MLEKEGKGLASVAYLRSERNSHQRIRKNRPEARPEAEAERMHWEASMIKQARRQSQNSYPVGGRI